MAKWDLTQKIGVYLDRHLIFPLMEFVFSNEIYDPKSVLAAKLKLVFHTDMWDYSVDIWKLVHCDVPPPEELLEKRIQSLKNLKSLQNRIEEFRRGFVSLTGKPDVVQILESSRDTRFLVDLVTKELGFKPEMIDTIYSLGKNQFECGNYGPCAETLYICLLLMSTNDKNYLNVLWGKLASEILIQNWDLALDDFIRLKDYIDSNTSWSALVALQQRTWLIHWGLFVFFNHSKGQDMVVDMFLFQAQYLNAIQTTCPYILRYLTAAVITNKQRLPVMKELVKVIEQESYAYRDPITEFVECLFVNFDFDAAQLKLRECELVLKSDFFLVSCLEPFMENARMVIFETFCCIHQCISIDMLAEKLNLTPEEAEKWIVNLVRNARLDAKIDLQLGHVVMEINTLSPYQQLIEKTKVLSFRTQMMASNLEKKAASNLPERVPHWAAQDF